MAKYLVYDGKTCEWWSGMKFYESTWSKWTKDIKQALIIEGRTEEESA